jgi:multicomponent Na+:H+ antiporter subunit B
MNRKLRRRIFIPALFGLLGLFLWGLGGLPTFGHCRSSYGDWLNAASVPVRHVTDVVTAINFDFRGLDTLGEEFILFSSVMGVLLLLRQQRDESPAPPRDKAPERCISPTSDAVRVLGLMLIGPIILFGIYTVVHGQLTPGGGFQGGVILSVAPLMIYLAGDYETFSKITSHRLTEVAEALGAGGYIVVGLGGIVWGASFLQNVLPLGKVGSVFSGGTIALIDAGVGLEVSAGFVLLSLAYLQETLELRMRSRR